MKFLVKYIMEVNEDELVELANDYFHDGEEVYKSIKEIPEDEILDVLFESGYLEEDIDYELDLGRLSVSILENGDSDKMV